MKEDKPIKLSRAIRRNASRRYKMDWSLFKIEAPKPNKNSRSTLRVERERKNIKLNLVAAAVPPLVTALYARMNG